MQSIYKLLKDAGCEIDHHATDLYVKKTPQSIDIVEAWAKAEHYPVQTFYAADNTGWWYDIPFQYDPGYNTKVAK